jgi:hypothetical protein
LTFTVPQQIHFLTIPVQTFIRARMTTYSAHMSISKLCITRCKSYAVPKLKVHQDESRDLASRGKDGLYRMRLGSQGSCQFEMRMAQLGRELNFTLRLLVPLNNNNSVPSPLLNYLFLGIYSLKVCCATSLKLASHSVEKRSHYPIPMTRSSTSRQHTHRE